MYRLTVFSKLDAKSHVSKNSPTLQRHYTMFRLPDDDPKPILAITVANTTTDPQTKWSDYLHTNLESPPGVLELPGVQPVPMPLTPQVPEFSSKEESCCFYFSLASSEVTILKCSANSILPIKNYESPNLKLGSGWGVPWDQLKFKTEIN